jgi:pilus assembly protein Flp/PilA
MGLFTHEEQGEGGESHMMVELFNRIRTREEGQALVEYALILALVSVAAIGTLTLLGQGIDGILTTIVGSL